MEELDELLRRVRREYDPDAAAQQRVRNRLGVALTAGVAAGLVAGTKGAAAAGGGVGLGQAGGGSVAGFVGKGLFASAWGKSAWEWPSLPVLLV
jgi:hypothetical protein